MAKLPTVSDNFKPVPETHPFLSCMSIDSLALLDAALYYNHRQHIITPAPGADIMPFDAEREMRQVGSEEHMRK